ncbi:HlyD family type I secretion periplasmic adaptor subunit [Methylomonas fluvii]|uniref:Membrane fusion protein (MFP) family protein n=1 Tax=Methylomonas fluvii TaxID=1854564 RepID=A0ABR9D9Z9_9GAMM|nr:HlyD family type I secretion periplasmic adaptor subunit [Methylomonas fluvii]MBD9359929.1 HlyD family type I secretion periplasmic adaptor subunit [Methylomonas fluvii]
MSHINLNNAPGKPATNSGQLLDFQPGLLRIQRQPPHPMACVVLYSLLILLVFLLAWAAFGELDIVAVAEGKLVPSSYLKIVQPAEQGIVKDILVQEGESVEAGQVLMRMDAVYSDADRKTLTNDYHSNRLALRRIDAQLSEHPLQKDDLDPPELYGQVASQYAANIHAYRNALSQERSVLEKAQHDLTAAEQVKTKLVQTLPHYREQENAFEQLAKRGYGGRIQANEKVRERIEKEQDLLTQASVIQAAKATITQSRTHIEQITADYLRQLQADRVDVSTKLEKVRQELAKIEHRNELLELKAPQAAVIKDLATHTIGTVASPGTILMTLVPINENLRAEVWVTNEDIGFIRPGQPVKLKLAAFPFQKYGLVEASISHVSADAVDKQSSDGMSQPAEKNNKTAVPLAYRALADLRAPYLENEGQQHLLTAGMQVSAEIKLGTRTVLEYLLSPVRKAFHEAARER